MTPALDGPILGIEVTSPEGGVALADVDRWLFEAPLARGGSPSRALLPLIRTALERCGLTPRDVAGYAVSTGPGSFTGIRVGLATVAALARAAGRPLLAIPTLWAVAEAAREAAGRRPVAAWLDAGRGEVYAILLAAGWQEAAPIEAREILAPPAALLTALPDEPILFAGEGAVRHREAIRSRPRAHRQDEVHAGSECLARAVARLGRRSLAAGWAVDPRPRYVRPPEALRARP